MSPETQGYKVTDLLKVFQSSELKVLIILMRLTAVFQCSCYFNNDSFFFSIEFFEYGGICVFLCSVDNLFLSVA